MNRIRTKSLQINSTVQTNNNYTSATTPLIKQRQRWKETLTFHNHSTAVAKKLGREDIDSNIVLRVEHEHKYHRTILARFKNSTPIQHKQKIYKHTKAQLVILYDTASSFAWSCYINIHDCSLTNSCCTNTSYFIVLCAFCPERLVFLSIDKAF